MHYLTQNTETSLVVFLPTYLLRTILCDYFRRICTIYWDNPPSSCSVKGAGVQTMQYWGHCLLRGPSEWIKWIILSYNIVIYTSTQCYPGPWASDGYRASPISRHHSLCPHFGSIKSPSWWAFEYHHSLLNNRYKAIPSTFDENREMIFFG